MLLQGYLAFAVIFSIWLAVAAYGGLTDVRWPYVVLAAASIAVFGALARGNTFTLEKLTESIFLTGRTAAMVCWLFVGSAIFSSVFAVLGGQAYVEKFVLSLG